MRKKIRKILHSILKIEISMLFLILYYVVIIPMSFFQKIPFLFTNKQYQKTNWQSFTEKYHNLQDLMNEG